MIHISAQAAQIRTYVGVGFGINVLAAAYPTLNFYEGLAEELEQLSQAVSTNPNLNDAFAERLKDLAQQLREDTAQMRVKGQKV